MGYLSQDGLDALWLKIKALFTGAGASVTASTASTTVDIVLKDSASTPNTLSTATIPAATDSKAGVMTAAEHTKLAGVASGAEVNVQSDWNQTDDTKDDFIKNKPVIPEGATLYSGTGQNTDGAMTQKATTDALDLKAPLASPALTGTPTAPTATAGTNTTQVATTAFVATAITGLANQNAFSNIAVGTTTVSADSATDTVTLSAGNQISLSAVANTDTITVSHAESHTAASAAAKKVGMDKYGHVVLGDALAVADISGAAPLASPALTGTPTAPTATTGTNTTQIATTAFVQQEIGGIDAGVTGVKGDSETSYRAGNVNITAANIGVEAGAEVNQNAFSNIAVGSDTIAADSKTDTLTVSAGTGITVSATTSSDTLTIGHASYTAAEAAAVKVGNDATGHVIIGSALTASDVGAAASTHNHAAGDITSGTLGVSHGGTGVNTLGAGVVYHSASGTGALSIATASNIVSAIGNTAVNRATSDGSGNNIGNTYAKLASPALTGTPTSTTAATGTNTTQIATTAFVQQEITAAQTGAAMYKGTLTKETDLTGLTNYKQGWYWVVSTGWTSTALGITLDTGDMVFCNTTASTFVAANFDVVSVDIEAIPISYIQALS